MEALPDTCGRTLLLLISLFVLEAAADCPPPEGKDNIVLTNAALLLNAFPEGIEVSLECANGYETESGSGEISCIDGSWTEPDLICKKMDCGPPTPQPNMSFNTSGGTLFGATVKVICDKGYRLKGTSYKNCYVSGWSGKASCQIVTCQIPDVANGRSLWDSLEKPVYGQTVKFVCEQGYTLSYEGDSTCSETGAFHPQPPECRGATTEDRITTKVARPTSALPTQAMPTSTASPATSTAHRDTTIVTSTAPTVSPSAQGGTDRDVLTAEDTATTASTPNLTSTTSLFQDMHDGNLNAMDAGYMPVIVSVICVSLAVCIIVSFLHKFQQRKKGSYDTGEDLKPELLQFQNL